MSDKSKKGSVLLIGADQNPAMPILESLAQHGIDVSIAAPRRLSIGFFSRYPRERLLHPDPEEAPDRFQEWAEAVLKRGDYKVALVCGEEATWLLAQVKSRIATSTRIPIPDPETFLLCRDKSRTMKAAQRLGVPTPVTYFPEDIGIEEVRRQIPRYPVVLKPCVANGARGISYPKDGDELVALYETTRARFGPCIVQEFVPHSGMQYKVEALLDQEQRVLAAGVYDKPRYYPPTGGSSTLNSTVHRPDIVETGLKFLQGIRWYGMGDCDFIEDPTDGKVKLMEVNPRFTRSIKILVKAGLDFPYLLYRMALGLPVTPQRDYEAGIYLRYLLSDCVWFLRSPDRLRSKPSFFWFYGRKLHEEIFSLSDPAPFFAFCLSRLLEMFDAKRRWKMLRLP